MHTRTKLFCFPFVVLVIGSCTIAPSATDHDRYAISENNLHSLPEGKLRCGDKDYLMPSTTQASMHDTITAFLLANREVNQKLSLDQRREIFSCLEKKLFTHARKGI